MNTKKVTLKKPHRHAGVDYPANTELEVEEHDAAFLLQNDIIEKPARSSGGKNEVTQK